MLRRVPWVVSGLLALAPVVGADVLTVDVGGGAAFTSIQDAVDAAVDGDVVLIAHGTYPGPIEVDGKGIILHEDSGGTVTIAGGLHVHDLEASQTFVARGLHVETPTGPPLLVESNDGQLRFEQCSFWAQGGSLTPDTAVTVRFGAGTTAFNDCHMTGADGVLDPALAGPGGGALFVRLADVALYDCSITGGDGADGVVQVPYEGGAGGHGVEIVGGSLLVSRGQLSGGSGGDGTCFQNGLIADCGSGGRGGDGLTARGGAVVRIVAFDGEPGAGGDLPEFVCCPTAATPGGDGVDLALEGGASVVDYGDLVSALIVDSPVREGEPNGLGMFYYGSEGDDVFLFLSLSVDGLHLPKYHGMLLLGFPLIPETGIHVGAVPRDGGSPSLWAFSTVPELGPGVEGVAAHAQVVFRQLGSSQFHLGPMSTSVLLDSSF